MLWVQLPEAAAHVPSPRKNCVVLAFVLIVETVPRPRFVLALAAVVAAVLGVK